jgi:hypothetical protein
MSDNLRDLLATWFTTGLLNVERVTWQSPCEIGRILNNYFSINSSIY